MEDLIEALSRVSILSEVDDTVLSELAARSARASYAAGQVLFHEGDPGDAVYIILSGTVRVARSGGSGAATYIAHRGTGECVGEMALLDGLPRTADVVVVEPADIVKLNRSDFTSILAHNPKMTLAVMQVVASRLRQAQDAERQQSALSVSDRAAQIIAQTSRTDGS